MRYSKKHANFWLGCSTPLNDWIEYEIFFAIYPHL